MSKQNHTHAEHHDIADLAADARALVAATADVAGEKVVAARQRLSSALESGKEMYENVKDRVVEGAKTTDKTIRKHPYQSIGIALGVGALLGYLLARKR